MLMFEELGDIFSDHDNYLTSRELLMKVRISRVARLVIWVKAEVNVSSNQLPKLISPWTTVCGASRETGPWNLLFCWAQRWFHCSWKKTTLALACWAWIPTRSRLQQHSFGVDLFTRQEVRIPWSSSSCMSLCCSLLRLLWAWWGLAPE